MKYGETKSEYADSLMTAALHEDARSRLNHSIAFARDGLRGMLIINGGAVVGLFTLVGAMSSAEHPMLEIGRVALWVAFAAFAAGTATAVGSSVAAFLSQDFFYMQEDRSNANRHLDLIGSADQRQDIDAISDAGEKARVIGIVLAVLSLLSFITGAVAALISVA